MILELKQCRLFCLSVRCLFLPLLPPLSSLPVFPYLSSFFVEPLLKPIEVSHLVVSKRLHLDILRELSSINQGGRILI